jgi:hypothetical protein
MALSLCDHCGNPYTWNWTEAFEKFGFNDGAGPIETPLVESTLRRAGYDVETMQWGLHNLVICSIKKDGVELIRQDDPLLKFGYDYARAFLPQAIIDLLDVEFPPG